MYEKQIRSEKRQIKACTIASLSLAVLGVVLSIGCLIVGAYTSMLANAMTLGCAFYIWTLRGTAKERLRVYEHLRR